AELKIKEELFQKREDLDREAELKRQELRDQERRLEKREDGLEQKNQALLKKERSLESTQKKLSERRAEVEKRGKEAEALGGPQTQKLHEIPALTREQARDLLLERLARELTEEIAQRIRRHEEQLKASCDDKARQILATCIHRYAAEHTADTTVSTVDI